MRSKGFPVALATALMLAAVQPTSAASDYDTGFIKTVDRSSVTEKPDGRSEGFYQVRDGGKGRHKGQGHRRGRGHHGNRGHHGRHGGRAYYAPRHRYYGGPYGHRRNYYYGDYLGAFVLGGVLGYYLNDGYYVYD